jgi:hypothetical protein
LAVLLMFASVIFASFAGLCGVWLMCTPRLGREHMLWKIDYLLEKHAVPYAGINHIRFNGSCLLH